MIPSSRANPASPIMRTAMFSSSFGMINDHLIPTESTRPTLKTSPFYVDPYIQCRELSLTDIEGEISYVMDNKVKNFKDYITLLEGQGSANKSGHHFGLFGGAISDSTRTTYGGRSIDHILRDSPEVWENFNGSQKITRFSASNKWYDRPFTEDGNTLLAGSKYHRGAISNGSDLDIFNQLFDFKTPDVTDPKLKRKLLLTDKILNDYKALKSHRRISSSDKILLDEFVDGVFEVQKKLAGQSSRSQARALKLNFEDRDSRGNIIRTQEAHKNFQKMISLTFLCDQTRIATTATRGNIHHSADDKPEEMYGPKTQKEYIDDVIFPLADDLLNMDDPYNPGTKVLDNTLIIWMNEHQDRSHHMRSIPVFTIGKLGSTTPNTGKILSYRKDENWRTRGMLMKQLMAGVLKSFGVPDTQINKNGDGDGFGDWRATNNTNVTSYYNHSWFDTNHGKSLPYFFKHS